MPFIRISGAGHEVGGSVGKGPLFPSEESAFPFSFREVPRNRSRGRWQWHKHDPVVTLRFLIMVMVMLTKVGGGTASLYHSRAPRW